jgi:hypothetical protein
MRVLSANLSRSSSTSSTKGGGWMTGLTGTGKSMFIRDSGTAKNKSGV